jgi:mRNA-degrading endonuclease RelE of RelBE toxin-antitoxin system
LLLVVGIAIAYDTFFAEEVQKEISKLDSANLNFFSKFIKEFSKDMPFFYGLFYIMFAVLLGIGAAFIRRFFSNLRKKYFSKPAK